MNQLVTTIPPGALEQLRRKAATANLIETWKPHPGETLEGLIHASHA